MRAVLDPNVLISAILSAGGTPAQLIRCWQVGEFELIVSEKLMAEVARALAHPKPRKLVPAANAAAFIGLVERSGTKVEDIDDPPVSSRDPGDDYLIALASSASAILVSGDGDLLTLADRAPIESPRQFLDRLRGG